MRQRMLGVPLSGTGNAREKDGAACTAGKATLPIEADSVNPNIPRAWLNVVRFWI